MRENLVDLYTLDLEAMGIDTVALDYGGVIADMIEESSMAILAETCSVEPGSFVRPYWDLRPSYDSGKHDFASYMRLVLESCGSPAADTADYRRLFSLDTSGYSHLREPMLKWMRRLKAGGITLMIISNIAYEAAEILIEGTVLAQLCTHRVYSGQVGINKPDPGIYLHALNLLGGEAGSVLFIDDRRENAEASMKVGFRSAHFIGDTTVSLL